MKIGGTILLLTLAVGVSLLIAKLVNAVSDSGESTSERSGGRSSSGRRSGSRSTSGGRSGSSSSFGERSGRSSSSGRRSGSSSSSGGRSGSSSSSDGRSGSSSSSGGRSGSSSSSGGRSGSSSSSGGRSTSSGRSGERSSSTADQEPWILKLPPTCLGDLASLSIRKSNSSNSDGENRRKTTGYCVPDRFIEIEFKLKFGCFSPTLIDQGVRLEFALHLADPTAINNNDWFPIRYYTPSLRPPRDYRSLVELQTPQDSVNAQSILYNSSFPIMLINPSESIRIHEYICDQFLQNNMQLQLRWMQRFGRSSSSINDAAWILDDIKIRIWNGSCFLQVLSEDFSREEEIILNSYDLVAADIQTPSCNSPGNGSAIYFGNAVSNNEEITSRSITILNYLDVNSKSCEARSIENTTLNNISCPIDAYTAALESVLLQCSSNRSVECHCESGMEIDNVQCKGSVVCSRDQTLSFNISYSWPSTEVGYIASLPCGISSGMATRMCGPGGVWLQSNTSPCDRADNILSHALTEAATSEMLEVQLGLVAFAIRVTEDDEIQQTPMLLDMLASYFTAVNTLITSNESSVVSRTVVMDLVQIINSIGQWPATHFKDTDASSRIIMSFESVAAKFTQNLEVNQSITESGDNFFLTVENVPLDKLKKNGRSFNDENHIQSNKTATIDQIASITLPSSAFDTINDSEVGVFFALYRQPTLFPVRNEENIRGAVRGRTTIVGSSIIAASVVVQGLSFNNLRSPVIINLSVPTEIQGNVIGEDSAVCVSWDFSAAGSLGNWIYNGCITFESSKTVVTCHCNHLTNFAVLIDICSRVQPEGCMNSEVFESTLSVITYIGAALSIFGSIITVITFLAFKKLRGRHESKFHIQLCLAIIFMLVAFVGGVDKTALVGGCMAASILIHYFTLASILWMSTESLLMFQKLVFVFKQVTKKWVIITSLVCWLIPIVPVAIPLIIDMANGREASNDLIIEREKYCFLSDPIVFWLAFLGPVLAIVLVNTVIFIIVIVILIRHTRRKTSGKNESIEIKKVVSLTLALIGIMFLFGISWLFAALTFTVKEIRVVSQVLFTVFNSSQGVVIFVFFCIFNKVARESWKEVLSCGKYKSAFLNPSKKINKNSSMMKNQSQLSSQNLPVKYPLKNNMSTTTIFTRESSSDLSLGCSCNGGICGSNIYSIPEHPGEEEKRDLSSTFVVN